MKIIELIRYAVGLTVSSLCVGAVIIICSPLLVVVFFFFNDMGNKPVRVQRGKS